jgi:hypothetical protein
MLEIGDKCNSITRLKTTFTVSFFHQYFYFSQKGKKRETVEFFKKSKVSPYRHMEPSCAASWMCHRQLHFLSFFLFLKKRRTIKICFTWKIYPLLRIYVFPTDILCIRKLFLLFITPSSFAGRDQCLWRPVRPLITISARCVYERPLHISRKTSHQK